jgi:hypothetical protein
MGSDRFTQEREDQKQPEWCHASTITDGWSFRLANWASDRRTGGKRIGTKTLVKRVSLKVHGKTMRNRLCNLMAGSSGMWDKVSILRVTPAESSQSPPSEPRSVCGCCSWSIRIALLLWVKRGSGKSESVVGWETMFAISMVHPAALDPSAQGNDPFSWVMWFFILADSRHFCLSQTSIMGYTQSTLSAYSKLSRQGSLALRPRNLPLSQVGTAYRLDPHNTHQYIVTPLCSHTTCACCILAYHQAQHPNVSWRSAVSKEQNLTKPKRSCLSQKIKHY